MILKKQTYIICLQVLPVSLNCVFEVQNFVLCLTHESLKFLDYKIMLELQCETTFNSAIVGKISSKSNKNWLWDNVLKKCGLIWNIYWNILEA